MSNIVNSSFSPDGNVSFENVYIYGTLYYDFDDKDITFKSLNVTGKSIFNNDIDLSGNLNVSNDAKVTGIATFNNIEITGQLIDGDGDFGSSGQILSSDGTNLEWINSSSANVGSASKVGVNLTSDSTTTMYLTFVDSTSGNEEVRVDKSLTYKPSTGSFLGLTTFTSIEVNGDATFTGDSSNAVWDKSQNSLEFDDNSKAKFGNNGDLKLSHTNSLSGQNDSQGNSILDGGDWSSLIEEDGAGPLIFKSNGGPGTGAYQFYDASWKPILKMFSGNSARVGLYYAGLEKLVTDLGGISISGGIKDKDGNLGSSGQVLSSTGTELDWISLSGESDTLDTVCDRGSSTDQNITTSGTLNDAAGNVREIVNNTKTGAYTLTANDVGELINTNSNVTIPSGVFSAGQGVTIYNNSSSNITIARSGVTAYTVGTATNTDKTLAQKGLATVMCVSANTFVVLGGGLS